MSTSVFSQHWYRVNTLHPRLRAHVSVQRRFYRGAAWYLLRDASSGRFHRVSETAYHVAGRLTGGASVQEIWDLVVERLGECAPTQDEVIALLSTLHENHLIQSERVPDVDELFSRRDSAAKKKRLIAVNPFSFRVPLLDPTMLLNRWVRWVRPLYTRAGLMVWALVVAVALSALSPHWREVTSYGARLMETRYLVLMALCYPVIKALHELGHAFAVRVWGGEVREMGVALMMLIPVPYVDASAASGFKERHRRVVVGAAGIMVELFLAALAALLWLNAEQGMARDIAFVVMALGGLSTALFNGNPLMRLDGYYVLSDALETPNLGARSNASFLALVQRYLLGVKHAVAPRAGAFERWFLPLFAVASNLYRLFISGVILLWISAKSLPLALLLGGWVLFTSLGVPVYRAKNFLLRSPALARYRTRAVGASLGILLAALAFLFVIPVPASSPALGVVWFPEGAQIRAPASGFVKAVHGGDGASVAPGAVVIALHNPEMEAELKIGEARVQGLQVRVRHALWDQPADLQAASQELASVEAQLRETQRQAEGMRIQAQVGGQLVLPHAADLLGSYIKQGTTLGHVVTRDDLVIRVAVSQEQAGRIREGIHTVEVQLRERPAAIHHARVLREVPAAGNQLHSAALGDRAGGYLRTDPADTDGLKTLEPVFFFDLGVPGMKPERVGGRVHVRFDHGAEPIAFQLRRTLRQVFLRHVGS